MIRESKENRFNFKFQTMKCVLRSLIYFYVLQRYVTIAGDASTIAPITNEYQKSSTKEVDEGEVGSIPMTEEVIDPNIKISELPDVVDATESLDSDWDKNKVIRDVAYFMRAHKFQDYDRRYYKNVDEARSRLYVEFPKPLLRSLHWEVRKYCHASFVECLKYLERIIKQTSLRREDDTATIVKEQKWNLLNNTEQILTVQRDCQTAQRRDNLTMAPFQGPIERFQWRTSVSYYMCWYTMLGVPELGIFGESCDNHANCLIENVGRNTDPRADDTKPYACALYSFCPDHCCPMKHIRYMKDCFQSRLNPCYRGNTPAHRKCILKREENRDFHALQANWINVTCECSKPGYEWSSRFGLCVDINECARGMHNCSNETGKTCINLPGRSECICKLGYVYNARLKDCIHSPIIEQVLAEPKIKVTETNITERKSLLALITMAVTKSISGRLTTNYNIVAIVIVHFLGV